MNRLNRRMLPNVHEERHAPCYSGTRSNKNSMGGVMRKSFAIFGLVAFAAIGCSTETVSSENIKTGGIAATIEVISDDPTHTNVWATLRVGGD
ncbi:MAG TPA: hypothetical protein PLI95_19750, partial [Polyangiaceae bacterium]|nr:hypothetical protein [Polyangiaceae bacterium]